MKTIKGALKNKSIVRALNGLVGCPSGGWPETNQAFRQLREELPRREERNYTMFELVGHCLTVDHADRYAWKEGT